MLPIGMAWKQGNAAVYAANGTSAELSGTPWTQQARIDRKWLTRGLSPLAGLGARKPILSSGLAWPTSSQHISFRRDYSFRAARSGCSLAVTISACMRPSSSTAS
jgi:hypothetical protein